MIVTLAASTDYLKRIAEVVPNSSQGLTQTELDAASNSAEDDVLSTLAAEGFSVSGFTTTSNTPFAVIEIIKMLASARVWARALMLYDNKKPFNESFGQGLLDMANAALDNVIKRGILRAQNGTVITPTLTQAGKGCPKFANRDIGSVPTPFAVPDADIARFINEHGQSGYQVNPFDQIQT